MIVPRTNENPLRGQLTAAVSDDQIRDYPDHEARADHQQTELAVAVAAHPGPYLADHVQDRPAGGGVEGELQRPAGHAISDDRAEERGPTANEAGQAQPRPRRSDVTQRANNPESLCGVVQGKADDQNRREGDCAGPGRDTDRPALGEAVNT